jgi:ribosome-associated protein
MTEDTWVRARVAAEALDAKQAHDVVVLDVGDILAITDAFVIGHGTNTRQVRTLVDEVERRMLEECDAKPRGREGVDDGAWVVLDYGDVVVHVFLDEAREFYGLDRLWADARRVDWQGVAVANG